MLTSRRTHLKQLVAAGVVVSNCLTNAADEKPNPLARQLGITTGSFMKHLSAKPAEGKLRLLDLPKIMHDQLGFKVIDLMTATVPSWEPSYLDEFKGRAAEQGCIITNLKMNQKELDMASPDAELRAKSIKEYHKTMDSAARLGCRWVRPLPSNKRPEMKLLVESYQELIAYGKPLGLELLIENNGWMKSDPEGIPSVMKAVGQGLHAAPDTGNWADASRYEGLAKAFPLAITCDFKALQFPENGEHTAWDLERTFRIAWDAGFRGPWCFEHFNETLPGLWRGFEKLGSLLRKWMGD